MAFLASVIGRMLLALIFIISGVTKVMNVAETQAPIGGIRQAAPPDRSRHLGRAETRRRRPVPEDKAQGRHGQEDQQRRQTEHRPQRWGRKRQVRRSGPHGVTGAKVASTSSWPTSPFSTVRCRAAMACSA